MDVTLGGTECTLRFSRFQASRGLNLHFLTRDEGHPYAGAVLDVDKTVGLEPRQLVIRDDLGLGIHKTLIEAGIATDAGKVLKAGPRNYPIVTLTDAAWAEVVNQGADSPRQKAKPKVAPVDMAPR